MQPKTFRQKAWKILLTVQKVSKSYKISKQRLFFKTFLWTRRTQLWQHCLSSLTKNKKSVCTMSRSIDETICLQTFQKKMKKYLYWSSGNVEYSFGNFVWKRLTRNPKFFHSLPNLKIRSVFPQKSFYSKCTSGHIDSSCDDTAKRLCLKVQRLHNNFSSIEKVRPECFPWGLRNLFWQPRRNFFSKVRKFYARSS